ncbi:hypothetical protein MTO96_032831 [Rhipicephalus appendiculatus]
MTDLMWSGAALHVAHKAFRIFLGQYAEWLQKIAASKTLYTQSQLFFLGFVSAKQMYLVNAARGAYCHSHERARVGESRWHSRAPTFAKPSGVRARRHAPFWRLEENDCWEDRVSVSSWQSSVQTANDSLIDSWRL